MKENEFSVAEVPPGRIKLVHVNGQRVACIESVVCQTPPGNAYQAPGSPRYGCGL